MVPGITVEAKVVGRERPLFSGWDIPVPPLEDGNSILVLRDLIRLVVACEVSTFQQRQEERRLARVFSAEEIALGERQGKVHMGGQEPGQPVDQEAAEAAALQAFEDGLYYIFLDDVQQQSLDQQVSLRPGSRLLFLRLIALAGG